MLRILVISLVVANLLLLGFQSSRPVVQPETKTRVAPAPARATGIPTIHLFSEMMKDQGLLSDNRQCFTLGPFHLSGDMDDVRGRLQDVSIRISERETEALVEKGYWVYMPPYASLLEANKELLALQALGLNDVGIIYDGEWANAVSLGYFMRQENAQRRKQDLERRGHNPVIRIQRQAEPRYWLDYEQSPGSALIALDMQSRPNDFMQRPVPCPETDFLEASDAGSQDGEQELTQAQTSADDDPPAMAEAVIPDEPEAVAEETSEPVSDNTESPAVNKAEDDADSSADEETGNAKNQPVATAAVQEPEKSVEPPPVQEEETEKADPESPPKQTVGTGPEHSLPAVQQQDGQDSTGKGADDTSGTDAGASAEPAAPEEKESGDGNGTSQDGNSG